MLSRSFLILYLFFKRNEGSVSGVALIMEEVLKYMPIYIYLEFHL